MRIRTVSILALVVVPALSACTTGSEADDPGAGDTGGKSDGTGGSGCRRETLVFSADELPAVPAQSSRKVWGGNATQGNHVVDPPYDEDFVAAAHAAKARGLEVFGYLEGPCGDTGGVDDGERARCRTLHRDFNARFSPNTPDTAFARWKPFTLEQMRQSGALGVDYCEIDNLSNNITVPLIPLMRELKDRFDEGVDHCQLVFKNVSVDDLGAIKEAVAPTSSDAGFIAPFHIYEADDTSEKPDLDAAMRDLKGPGAVTIISLDTNHYGSRFTPDHFSACR